MLRVWGEQLIPDRPIPIFILQGSVNRYVWAKQFTKGGVILDVACGSGYGSNYLKEKGAKEIVGGDLSRDAVAYAASRYKGGKIHFVRLSADSLPFASCSFDSVVSFETIEHLEKYEGFAFECERILKDRGQFVCSTPNRAASLSDKGKPLAHYHFKEFSITEFRRLLERYFSQVRLYGMDPQGKGNKILYLIAARFQYLVFSVPHLHRLINFFTKFFFVRYHLVKLSECSSDTFDRIVDEKYRPYPLECKSLIPGDIIGISIKGLNIDITTERLC